MGKRILISEQEKKDIKEMYNLNEDWIDDVVGFIKDTQPNEYEKLLIQLHTRRLKLNIKFT